MKLINFTSITLFIIAALIIGVGVFVWHLLQPNSDCRPIVTETPNIVNVSGQLVDKGILVESIYPCSGKDTVEIRSSK